MLRNKSRNSPAGCQPLTGAGQRGFGGEVWGAGADTNWGLLGVLVTQRTQGFTGTPRGHREPQLIGDLSHFPRVNHCPCRWRWVSRDPSAPRDLQPLPHSPARQAGKFPTYQR